MHGLVKEVFVKQGDAVKAGQKLVIFEAMKMESTITAPFASKVKRVYLAEGVMVEQDDCVVSFS